MKILILVVTVFTIKASLGCTIPPIGTGKYQEDHQTLVTTADTIVLAKAIDFVKSNYSRPEIESGRFLFKTLETIKGAAPDSFSIEGYKTNYRSKLQASLMNHEQESFWKTKIGATTINNSMCLLEPGFMLGETYLLISGEQDDSKNYELIISNNDKWLIYVRKNANSRF